MCRDKKIEMVIEYLKENEDIFNELIEELDGYNGYLGDDRYYEMDMLDEFYCNVKPSEFINRVYYGRDDDTWTTDAHGNRTYGEFNPNREYFYYNGYGNLVSSDYKDYTGKLDSYFIEDVLENINELDITDDELLEMLEDIE